MKSQQSTLNSKVQFSSMNIDEFVRKVCEDIRNNKKIRRDIPGWGRVHIDRQVPFMVLYRRPVVGSDLGTEELVIGEAAHIIASGVKAHQPALLKLLRGVAKTSIENFGTILILEVWASEHKGENSEGEANACFPEFLVQRPKGSAILEVVSKANSMLSSLRVGGRLAVASTIRKQKCGPAHLSSILTTLSKIPNCHVLGLEVNPIYRNLDDTEVYSLVLRELRRKVTNALRPAFYQFVQQHTEANPKHFHVLGRGTVVKAVSKVDHMLSEVSKSFDFLLLSTPVNTEGAWAEFKRSKYEKTPTFRYRPIPLDPIVLKRNLYRPPVERIEDPVLLMIFRQKQEELDRQITMLTDVNTERFLQGSLQVYGGVDDGLSKVAEGIMSSVGSKSERVSKAASMDAREFAQLAEIEIAAYKEQLPEMNATVQVRSDIGQALMVSNGCLLIGDKMRIPRVRAAGLIAHEVGTHIVTYFNGQVQPFQLLKAGLAGYDALQEGLAVLSELLVGGLSNSRLRTLAARVIVIRDMVDGASFVDCFRKLTHGFGFQKRAAFTIIRRAYRGGGLTKDALYLRGLLEVIDHIKNNGDISHLFVGKFATDHIAVLNELRWRGILKSAPLVPRHLINVDKKLELLRNKATFLDIVRG